MPDDYYFIKGFSEHGFEVRYVSPRYRGPVDVSLDKYFVHDFPNVLEATERWPSLVRRPLWPVLFTACAVRRGMAVAREHPPSFVLGQTHLSAPAVRILARRLDVPSAVKLFGVVDLDRTDWSRWRYLRKNLEQILAFKVPQDAWLILDDGTGGNEAARRHGVPVERIRSLPNGVNVEWSEHVPEVGVRERYGIKPDAAVVLFLQRLIEWKRPDVFIRAAPRILQKVRRPVQFVIAGEGSMRGRCEQLAFELGVAPAIRFVGAIPHEQVRDIMSVATVFASTNRRSNLGIPTCEALVCGVPVVTFDVGGTERIVRNNETGRLVPDGDIVAFADAVAELVNDEEKRRALSHGARALARETFTGWTQRVRMEIEIVEDLMRRHERSRERSPHV
jgi:phosphatidylinositol alpha-1,6-mannosyltransferase